MKDLLAKLTTYNLFNYLFPGVVFAVLVTETTSYGFNLETLNDLIVGAFVAYFIGLAISRVGSLALEPILKRTVAKFANYPDYIAASKAEPIIEELSEVNNMYRTICAMLALLIVTWLYEALAGPFPVLDTYGPQILAVLLLLLFVLSYGKQTSYITKRVEAWKASSDSETSS